MKQCFTKGIIITKDIDEFDDLEISYLRKSNKTNAFLQPQILDIASVNKADVKTIIHKPTQSGTTKRRSSGLLFNFDFKLRNVN